MLRDRCFAVRRIGRYEVYPHFELRAVGFLVRWGRRGDDFLIVAQLGPFGVLIEPADD